MSSAKLTLIGFYKYDSTLFDGLTMPQSIDKSTLIDTILMNGGEYEVIYSDPDFLKDAISSWSRSWLPTFTEWCRAFTDLQHVAPLENYDRLEAWSDSENTSTSESENTSTSESESTSTSESTQGSSSTSGSDSSSGSESMNENTNMYAFDSSNPSPKDSGSKSSQSNNTARTYTEQGNRMSSIGQSSRGHSEGIDRELSHEVDRNFNHGGRIHGNIGVTTSAQMYKEWQVTLQDFGNMYNRIALVFLQNFVIPIL